jgi:hypothetical protein
MEWKHAKQFWYDRETTKDERLAGSYPETVRVAIFMRQREDGTMWYSTCTMWSLHDGVSSVEIARLKVENAISLLNWCSEQREAEKPVSEEEFASDCELRRQQVNGTWFELDNIESVVEGLR